MQITFTGIDGKEITVTDPMCSGLIAVAALPTPRRPTSWIISSWLVGCMKV